MNLGLEAIAIIVRLRAAASHANMRELTLSINTPASLLLKIVADFVLVEFLVEIRTKRERKLHEGLEVLGTIG